MCSHNLYWRQSHQLSCCTQCTITYAEHQQHSLPGSVTKFSESDSYAAPPNRATMSSLVAEILPFIPASYRYPCLTVKILFLLAHLQILLLLLLETVKPLKNIFHSNNIKTFSSSHWAYIKNTSIRLLRKIITAY